jgi:hypothetical protein
MKRILMVWLLVMSVLSYAEEGNTNVVGARDVTSRKPDSNLSETGNATPGSGMKKSMGRSP